MWLIKLAFDKPWYKNVLLFFSPSAYRCPLCMHSVWNMEDHWEQIDQEIAQSPMPPEYQGATVKVRLSGTHWNILNQTQHINIFPMHNVVFCATDYVQWLPNTLHRAFPRAGDEVQQLWLLQHCTRRWPHAAAAAADRAEHWGWGRNRAAYPAPVSYTTLKQHTTNKDG